MTGALSKNFHGVGIGLLSKILAVKGGLISESFSLWHKSPKTDAKNYFEHLFFRWIVLKIVFATFLGRFRSK